MTAGVLWSRGDPHLAAGAISLLAPQGAETMPRTGHHPPAQSESIFDRIADFFVRVKLGHVIWSSVDGGVRHFCWRSPDTAIRSFGGIDIFAELCK